MKLEDFSYQNFKLEELEDLIQNSRNGDSVSFEKLSQIVRRIAVGYFTSKLRLGKINNSEDVEDLSHNVFLSFHEQFLNILNLENWLRRVLFLTFVNYYKKNKSYKFYEIENTLWKKPVFQEFGTEIDAQRIQTILCKLSEEKQKIIKMRIWDDMKFSEIAEETKKSEDAVKKIFYRAIQELQGLL